MNSIFFFMANKIYIPIGYKIVNKNCVYQFEQYQDLNWMLRNKNREKSSQGSDSKSIRQNIDANQAKIIQEIVKSNDHHDESKQQGEQTMLVYTLRNLLAESAARQQKYINFIKEQKQQLFTATERYSDVMGKYEKEIKEFITKKQDEKQAKRFEKVHKMTTKLPPNQYNKQQYTTSSEYELSCKIVFKYFIPIVQDYLKQVFPQKFSIQFNQYYPHRENKVYKVSFDNSIDQEEIADRIKNGYSIEIYTADLTPACYNFVISHFHNKIGGDKILRYYRENQIQFMLRNADSQLYFGYGKIDLEQLLQFNPESEQSWVQKIPVVSLEGSDKIIAFMCLELSTMATSKKITHEHMHKISEPMSLNKQQIKVYNDKESRLIQRINQYKNVHLNIIPSAVKESADKNILMHQKRKQLQQIEYYKQATKNQYMEKVFGEAIEQYHTQSIEIGECKYVHFIYANHTDRHQKAKINLSYHRLKDQPDKNQISLTSNTNYKDSTQSISVQIVEPSHVIRLIQQRILSYPSKTQNCSIEFSIQNNYVFVVTGESILIYVKIVCHSLATAKYQLNLQLTNDFDEVLHNDMIILRATPPVPTHIFPMYSYPGEVNEVKVQIPHYSPAKESFNLIGKAKIANIVGGQSSFQFESNWTQNYEILELKITTLPKTSVNKVYNCYLLVYDVSYIVELACFQFCVECVDKIEDQKIQLGRTQTFNIKFKIPPVEGPTQKVLMRLGTSDYLQTYCKLFNTTQKTKEFAGEPNVQYPITINYNTFAQNPSTDKLIISCIDSNSRKPLRRLALILKKTPCAIKSIHRLVCPANQPLEYNFELYCSNKQQTTYKLYSSNYSLLTIAEDTVVLFTGQNKKIKLMFRYWQNENSVKYKSNEEKRSVILAVDDGKVCVLYQFEIRPDDDY